MAYSITKKVRALLKRGKQVSAKEVNGSVYPVIRVTERHGDFYFTDHNRIEHAASAFYHDDETGMRHEIRP